MKKLLAVALVALVLAGCSSGAKTQTLACNQASTDATMDSTFVFTDGALTKLEQVTVITIPEGQAEAVAALTTALDASKEQINAIDGASYEYSITDTSATITVKYDITKMSDETLLGFGFTDDMKVDGKFNIDKITETYKNIGIECTTK